MQKTRGYTEDGYYSDPKGSRYAWKTGNVKDTDKMYESMGHAKQNMEQRDM